MLQHSEQYADNLRKRCCLRCGQPARTRRSVSDKVVICIRDCRSGRTIGFHQSSGHITDAELYPLWIFCRELESAHCSRSRRSIIPKTASTLEYALGGVDLELANRWKEPPCTLEAISSLLQRTDSPTQCPPSLLCTCASRDPYGPA